MWITATTTTTTTSIAGTGRTGGTALARTTSIGATATRTAAARTATARIHLNYLSFVAKLWSFRKRTQQKTHLYAVSPISKNIETTPALWNPSIILLRNVIVETE